MPLKPKHPRITPLEPPYDDEAGEVMDLLGAPISLFRVFARRPALARGMHGWAGYYYSRDLSLDVRRRELVILRTTARCGADYEWGVHVAFFADKAGLIADQIASLGTGHPVDACWTDPTDIAVVRAVDALYDDGDLDDPTWAALVMAVGEEGALDLLLLTGWYHAISFAVRALRLPLEEGTAPIRTAG